jgi:5-enolpyruvylshikimate-3-phosphate synthase
MRSRVTGLVVGLVITALALVSISTLVAGASSSTPRPAKKLTLTLSSNGSTALASKGELVVVKLSGDHLRWSVARASQTTPVLSLVSERTTATGASTTSFRVASYGTADVSATGTPVCGSAGGCPQYVVLWHATVVVPVVDPPAPAAKV